MPSNYLREPGCDMWYQYQVSNHLMDTESAFAPWDLSKAHILVSTPEAGDAPFRLEKGSKRQTQRTETLVDRTLFASKLPKVLEVQKVASHLPSTIKRGPLGPETQRTAPDKILSEQKTQNGSCF